MIPSPEAPLGDATEQALFLVWGPPSHGPRSRVLARELGVDIEYLRGTRRRGPWLSPLRYPRQLVATIGVLARRRPRLVFVQSPPSFAPLVVALYACLSRARLVVDAHSDAMLAPHWTRPRWLYRWLARRATVTLVTNTHFAGRVRAQGGDALVLRDVPTTFPGSGSAPRLGEGFHVAVVATFARDEPLAAVVAAARDLPDVTFHITGDAARTGGTAQFDAPLNVIFTGFLPDDDYYGLLRGCDCVMCLTTLDNTMQRGACEALSLGQPIITSDWPLLRDYFSSGTVHVSNDVDGVRTGVERMRAGHEAYRHGIEDLRIAQRREWDAALQGLLRRLEIQPTTHGGDRT